MWAGTQRVVMAVVVAAAAIVVVVVVVGVGVVVVVVVVCVCVCVCVWCVWRGVAWAWSAKTTVLELAHFVQ